MAGSLPKDQILADVIAILGDMTADWDMDYSGGIRADTRLMGDLTFDSFEIVQLMVRIEQHFRLKNLASEKLLIRDGRYVPDLTTTQIAEFLCGEMNGQ
ncbi:MAG: acyl carrier protein [Planctomycetota bacterium]